MAGMTTNMMAVAGMVVITAAMAVTMAARPLVVIGMAVAVAVAETMVARPLVVIGMAVAVAETMAARPLVVIGMAVAMAETVVARPLMKSSITRRWAAAGMAARPHRAV